MSKLDRRSLLRSSAIAITASGAGALTIGGSVLAEDEYETQHHVVTPDSPEEFDDADDGDRETYDSIGPNGSAIAQYDESEKYVGVEAAGTYTGWARGKAEVWKEAYFSHDGSVAVTIDGEWKARVGEFVGDGRLQMATFIREQGASDELETREIIDIDGPVWDSDSDDFNETIYTTVDEGKTYEIGVGIAAEADSDLGPVSIDAGPDTHFWQTERGLWYDTIEARYISGGPCAYNEVC